ncbi:MAG TPA: hypothetical protein VN253_06740 [Kofleriaceae bacterium]|nr:hypothetical protein [Kofleriaceae bacterium]
MVCEGQSDSVIFEELIQKLWPEVVDIRRLHPEVDELDRAVGSSGWTGVREWCRRHAGKLASIIDPGIGQRLDVLVVALDIDIDIAVAAGISDPPKHGSAYDATRLCQTIKDWLRPTGAPSLPEELVIAVPSMATEAWAIAALYTSERNPENIEKPAEYLVAKKQLDWDADPERRKKRKIRKLPATYRRFAQQISGKLSRVRKACPEAARICRKIERRRDDTAR